MASSTSCTYRQVFNVVPILGGFPSFDSLDFSYVAFSEGMTIEPLDAANIKVTSQSGKSATFFRALLVFRDEFNSSAGVQGCVQRVEYNEETPVVVINESDRVSLSIGTLFLMDKGALVAKTVKLPSYSDKVKVAQFLHTYIRNYEADLVSTTSPCINPVTITTLPSSNPAAGISIVTLTFQSASCINSAWYVVDPKGMRIQPSPSTWNQFTMYGGIDGTTKPFRIGYVDFNGITNYSQIQVPLSVVNYTFVPNISS